MRPVSQAPLRRYALQQNDDLPKVAASQDTQKVETVVVADATATLSVVYIHSELEDLKKRFTKLEDAQVLTRLTSVESGLNEVKTTQALMNNTLTGLVSGQQTAKGKLNQSLSTIITAVGGIGYLICRSHGWVP